MNPKFCSKYCYEFFKGELIPKMYYINVSLWYQSLVDHFLSDFHLRPQRIIPEKGMGIKNCILNFQEQEWETGIPDSHSQLLGMGMKKPFPIFGRLVFPPKKYFFYTASILPTNQYRAGGYPLP